MATNQVLNVVDEILDDDPKFSITDNGDGTKNIELATPVVQQATDLNRNLFNKIDNILSYQSTDNIIFDSTDNSLDFNFETINSNELVNNQRMLINIENFPNDLKVTDLKNIKILLMVLREFLVLT